MDYLLHYQHFTSLPELDMRLNVPTKEGPLFSVATDPKEIEPKEHDERIYIRVYDYVESLDHQILWTYHRRIECIEQLLFELLDHLDIGTVYRHVFGFRWIDSQIWLAPNARYVKDGPSVESAHSRGKAKPPGEPTIELLVRFRPWSSLKMKTLDRNAHKYLFCQLRYEFFYNNINQTSKFKLLMQKEARQLVAVELARYGRAHNLQLQDISSVRTMMRHTPQYRFKWMRDILVYYFNRDYYGIQPLMNKCWLKCDRASRARRIFIDLFFKTLCWDYGSETYKATCETGDMPALWMDKRYKKKISRETCSLDIKVRYHVGNVLRIDHCYSRDLATHHLQREAASLLDDDNDEAFCFIEMRMNTPILVETVMVPQRYHCHEFGNSKSHLKRKHDSPLWIRVAEIDDIEQVTIRDNVVKILLEAKKERHQTIRTLIFKFLTNWHAASFVSAIDGYYRLMRKWNYQICSQIYSPYLRTLNQIGVHGPVSDYRINVKLNHISLFGAYTVSRGERSLIYKIFIKSPGHENFKVHFKYDQTEDGYKFCKPAIKPARQLHVDYKKLYPTLEMLISAIEPARKADTCNTVDLWPRYLVAPRYDEHYPNLLVSKSFPKGVPIEGQAGDGILYRLSYIIPTEYLKLLKYLLMPHTYNYFLVQRGRFQGQDVIAKSASVPGVLGQKQELHTFHVCLGGRGKRCHYATLNSKLTTNYITDFCELETDLFCKNFGISDDKLVQEYLPLGPLSQYLATQELRARYSPNKYQKVSESNLLSVCYNLSLALCHLKERNLVHGKIRCHNLFVVREAPILLVKLADSLGALDVHLDKAFLPPEYLNGTVELCLKTSSETIGIDVWAYGTTLWQIYSAGRRPEAGKMANFLDRPTDCPDEIWSIMQGCWNFKPELRPEPHAIKREMAHLLGNEISHPNREPGDIIDNLGPLSTQASDSEDDPRIPAPYRKGSDAETPESQIELLDTLDQMVDSPTTPDLRPTTGAQTSSSLPPEAPVQTHTKTALISPTLVPGKYRSKVRVQVHPQESIHLEPLAPDSVPAEPKPNYVLDERDEFFLKMNVKPTEGIQYFNGPIPGFTVYNPALERPILSPPPSQPTETSVPLMPAPKPPSQEIPATVLREQVIVKNIYRTSGSTPSSPETSSPEEKRQIVKSTPRPPGSKPSTPETPSSERSKTPMISTPETPGSTSSKSESQSSEGSRPVWSSYLGAHETAAKKLLASSSLSASEKLQLLMTPFGSVSVPAPNFDVLDTAPKDTKPPKPTKTVSGFDIQQMVDSSDRLRRAIVAMRHRRMRERVVARHKKQKADERQTKLALERAERKAAEARKRMEHEEEQRQIQQAVARAMDQAAEERMMEEQAGSSKAMAHGPPASAKFRSSARSAQPKVAPKSTAKPELIRHSRKQVKPLIPMFPQNDLGDLAKLTMVPQPAREITSFVGEPGKTRPLFAKRQPVVPKPRPSGTSSELRPSIPTGPIILEPIIPGRISSQPVASTSKGLPKPTVQTTDEPKPSTSKGLPEDLPHSVSDNEDDDSSSSSGETVISVGARRSPASSVSDPDDNELSEDDYPDFETQEAPRREVACRPLASIIANSLTRAAVRMGSLLSVFSATRLEPDEPESDVPTRWSMRFQSELKPVNRHATKEPFDISLLPSLEELQRFADQNPWRIRTSKLKIHCEIGRGKCGVVMKGSIHGRFVAAKTYSESIATGLHEKVSEDSLISEFTVLKALDNDKIVELIGATYAPNFTLVFEYLPLGSLRDKLRKVSWDRLQLEPLKKYCIDIALGMKYLQRQGVTHGDLSLRNILMLSDCDVKIGDFGLARFVDRTTGLAEGFEYLIPYQWYSPQTLRGYFYDSKADVWSFGVTVWEIFSGGKDPYSGYDPQSCVHKIFGGGLLPMPNRCPSDIARIICACWHEKLTERPNFDDILEALRSCKAVFQGCS